MTTAQGMAQFQRLTRPTTKQAQTSCSGLDRLSLLTTSPPASKTNPSIYAGAPCPEQRDITFTAAVGRDHRLVSAPAALPRRSQTLISPTGPFTTTLFAG